MEKKKQVGLLAFFVALGMLIMLFLHNDFVGIIFMLNLCHFIPSIKWLEYIGKNSIVFYFLAGGVPLVIGYLTKCYIPFEGYVMTFFVIAISLMLPLLPLYQVHLLL